MSSIISKLLEYTAGEPVPNYICDNPAPLASFDAPAYMGTWIDQSDVKDEWFQENSWTCDQGDYSNLNTTSGSFVVDNTSQNSTFGTRFGIDGNGLCPNNNGQCFVSFFDAPFPEKPNYNIVATDYVDYSIVYSCSAFRPYLWYLSRNATVTQEWRDARKAQAQAALPNFNFNVMIDPVQGSNCTYMDPQPGNGTASTPFYIQ